MALTVGTRRDDSAPGDSAFVAPPLAGLVVYQLTLDPAMGPEERNEVLDRVAALGVTAVELLPGAEPPEGHTQYLPAHVAVERSFGGAENLRMLVAEAHRHGLAVIVDIAYQRPDPGGKVVLDIAQESVRGVIVGEALRWLKHVRVDGIRHDMAAYGRLIDAASIPRPVGYQLIRELNAAIRHELSHVVLIALDERGDGRVTSMDDSGALFHAQWDTDYVHAIRAALDERGPMSDVRDVIGSSFGDTFSRIVYAHCAELIGREPAASREPMDWESAKRVTLGVGMVLTSPGVPLLFQGQEAAHGGQVGDGAHTPRAHRFPDLVKDLVRLRRNWYDTTRGLSGHGLDVFHCHEGSRVVAWHRWSDIGPGDDVVIVANLSRETYPAYRIGFPDDGPWRLRFSSDDTAYCELFGGNPSTDVVAEFRPVDAQPASAEVSIGPYSLLVFSQDAWPA
ncbi:MAG TPA: alpha amylase C-terminal domain-containing protein [Propionibacteriaceae bacterium]|nr:alpha amylase C-terminal domain-containing protein [Propionibacteriaceae bacterium]